MNGKNNGKISIIPRLLSNPKSSIAGIIAGLIIGIYMKSWVGYLAPFGNSYVGLLALCTFPITAASIILGLASTLKNRATNKKLPYLIVAFLCGMLLTFSVGALSGFIGSKNIISQQGSRNMASEIVSVETYSKANIRSHTTQAKTKQTSQSKLAFILKEITPHNIFAALNEGMTLKVILITLLIGIALGKSKSHEAETLLKFL